MSFLEKETARLLSNMPWYWVCVHWIVTLMILVVLVPVVLLIIVINPFCPFWFREWVINKMDSLLEGAFRLRLVLLGPVYNKYSLFDKIKDA
jgi:hypothetical protein